MPTATKEKKATTGDILERVQGLSLRDYPELAAWLDAASIGGFELPQEALDFADKVVHLAEQRATLPQPAAPVDGPARLLAGDSVKEVLRATQKAAGEAQQYQAAAALLDEADRYLRSHADVLLAEHRDALITGPLREAVAKLLVEAEPYAVKLQALAPDFSRNISDRGSGAEIELWQASRPLAQRLAVFHRAWSVSWGKVTRHGGQVPLEFHPQRPGGYFAWIEPDKVEDEALRFGRDTEPLRIVLAGSRYRLLAPSELQSVIEAIDNKIREEIERTGLRPQRSGHNLVRSGVCR